MEVEPLVPNRFGRLFPDLLPFRPKDEALKELGLLMRDETVHLNSNIPAGYTYLGQFIDHDITKDSLGDTDPAILLPLELSALIQQRTPSLDLDSLYGSGDTLNLVAWDPSDPAKFLLGQTEPSLVGRPFFNDLPRSGVEPTPAKALIGDPRNDENLAVAQTHLAFLKFHNAVVDVLRRDFNLADNPAEVRQQARELVEKHYQSIVLHDFLKQFVDDTVYKEVIEDGKVEFFNIIKGEMPFMPIEFSGAVYRWHTLIRENYNWNQFFNGLPDSGALADGTLRLLFQFTGRSNKDEFVGRQQDDLSRLTSEWVIDWTRFFDFANHSIPQGPGFNMTKPIDTLLTQGLGEPMNLATKNLIRGSRLGLPSAQDVARHMGIAVLSPVEMLQGNAEQSKVLEKHEFHLKTPLWYYINREAEFAGTGKFGKLASVIICEVFLGLAKSSRVSIFQESNWKPTKELFADPQRGENASFYTMTDLLMFVRANTSQAGVDELNPVG
ncbi:peroxidase family protein [Tellurirhabdus rosea]|uniref:peroxidase family protein n=1 Tax=Tellurirhabdus rosea TaxID=2674997 RepID=UPI00224ED261|nr:peroxidase family protein [Tellurirhabdus rosea]